VVYRNADLRLSGHVKHKPLQRKTNYITTDFIDLLCGERRGGRDVDSPPMMKAMSAHKCLLSHQSHDKKNCRRGDTVRVACVGKPSKRGEPSHWPFA